MTTALRDFARRGCQAADYALSGPEVWSHLCVRHLRDGWRIVVAFPEPDEVTIVVIDRHTRDNDPYIRLAEELGLALYDGARDKPPCCDAATLPPLDADLVEAMRIAQRRLVRRRP